MTEDASGDADVLIAARTSWEALRAEMATHTEPDDVYLCLACHRAARIYVDAVEALSRRVNG